MIGLGPWVQTQKKAEASDNSSVLAAPVLSAQGRAERRWGTHCGARSKFLLPAADAHGPAAHQLQPSLSGKNLPAKAGAGQTSSEVTSLRLALLLPPPAQLGSAAAPPSPSVPSSPGRPPLLSPAEEPFCARPPRTERQGVADRPARSRPEQSQPRAPRCGGGEPGTVFTHSAGPRR